MNLLLLLLRAHDGTPVGALSMLLLLLRHSIRQRVSAAILLLLLNGCHGTDSWRYGRVVLCRICDECSGCCVQQHLVMAVVQLVLLLLLLLLSWNKQGILLLLLLKQQIVLQTINQSGVLVVRLLSATSTQTDAVQKLCPFFVLKLIMVVSRLLIVVI